MNWIQAFDKLIAKRPQNNLSQMERAAYIYGFQDGYLAAQEDAQKKLDAYAAFMAGKITRAELEEAIK